MLAQIQFNHLVRTDGQMDWWRDPIFATKLSNSIMHSTWGQGLCYLRDGEGKKIADYSGAKGLVETITNLPEGNFHFDGHDAAGISSTLLIKFNVSMSALFLRFSTPAQEVRSNEIDTEAITVMEGISDAFSEGGMIGLFSTVSLPFLTFPRTRPPRIPNVWPIGHLAHCVDRKWCARLGTRFEQAYTTLKQASIPPSCRRWTRGDLLFFQWNKGMTTLAELREAQSMQYLWLSNTLNIPIDPQFNELGDQSLERSFLRPSKEATLFDPANRVALFAVFPEGDGTLDTRILEKIKATAIRLSLQKEGRITAVKLIVPDRDAVAKVLPLAESLGISDVVYADDDGELWTTRPEGDWVEE